MFVFILIYYVKHSLTGPKQQQQSAKKNKKLEPLPKTASIQYPKYNNNNNACLFVFAHLCDCCCCYFYCYYFITLKRFFVSSLACGPQYKPAKSYKWPYKSRKQIQTHEKKQTNKTKHTRDIEIFNAIVVVVIVLNVDWYKYLLLLLSSVDTCLGTGFCTFFSFFFSLHQKINFLLSYVL